MVKQLAFEAAFMTIRYHEFGAGTRLLAVPHGVRPTAVVLLQSQGHMRACGRCGHSNADHLSFCFSCGRRLENVRWGSPEGAGADSASAADVGGPSNAAGMTGSMIDGEQVTVTVTDAAPSAYALTMLVHNRRQRAPEGGSGAHGGGAARIGLSTHRHAWEALRYVFVYLRGRLDAEARRRQLIAQRDDAHRMLESAVLGLGEVIAAEGDTPPEFAELVQTIGVARDRRDTAIRELGITEKLQVSDDLRLGIEQSRAETEWRACDTRAAELDRLLRALEQERREVDEQLRAMNAASSVAESGAEGSHTRRAALHAEAALVDERHSALRERAAALRASGIAARAKFDRATSARRQAALDLTARMSAHTRDRLEAEASIHELTLQIGREAARLRLDRPSLSPGYAHLARLEAMIEERDGQLVGLKDAAGGYDARKLAIGIGVLASVAAALVGTIVLLRR